VLVALHVSEIVAPVPQALAITADGSLLASALFVSTSQKNRNKNNDGPASIRFFSWPLPLAES
jgi:multisubunit Na+/H+ antiporter MnhC subunit